MRQSRKLGTVLLYLVHAGGTVSISTNSNLSDLSISLCYPPCNPMPEYISAQQLPKSSNMTSIRGAAELHFNLLCAELESIMNSAASKIQSPSNNVIRAYSIKVLAPALRRYHEAHVALRQLSSPICFPKINEVVDPNSCRPDLEAPPLDPRPLDWAYYALAEKTIITRKEIFKQLCFGRELDSSGPISRYAPQKLKQQATEINLKIVVDSLVMSTAKKFNETTICVRNLWKGSKMNLHVVLNETFAALGAAYSEKQSEEPLKGLGSIRVIIYGTDYVAPTVEHRSITGLPIFPRGYIQKRFNKTDDKTTSAAWANFSDWQTLEDAFAVNESLMNPDSRWSKSFGSWEAMGLDFNILTANLFVRHPRVFPFPLGAPDHFHKNLERTRLRIRKHEIDYKKKHMLLLNFKPYGGPSGPSSSERQAIYRLAALGDPKTGVKPWTFANILPSKGDHNFTGTVHEMDYHYDNLASSYFVLSPRGNGLDCYRTWEALALGTIPIVKKSGPFDAIYEGLPVLLVSRWEEVTLELLEKTLQEWRHRRFPNLKRISVAGWLPARAR